MNEIFSHLIVRVPEDSKKRSGFVAWFSDTMPLTEFKGEDLIMKYYCDYSATLGVAFKYKYFATFLSTELKTLLIRAKIRVPGTDNLSFDDPAGLESAYLATREYMLNQYQILESYASDIEEFPVVARAYLKTKLAERLVEELSRTYETLSAKEDAVLAADQALDNLIMLRDIYDESSLDDLEYAKSRQDVTTVRKLVCDTGMQIIDMGISGGLCTGQLFGIEAQPGAGKTRFTLGTWVYRAAVHYHKDVIYYQLEQSEPEARAILIARHIFTLYGIQISDEMILTNSVPDELKQKVKAAEIDLFDSGKYGKIKIKRTTLYESTLIQTFKKDDKLLGPFDVIAVDYMGLIEQKQQPYTPVLLDYQIIRNSFRYFKRYVDKTGKCGIAVSQLNDKGIEAAKADKTITTNMAQGGIEVYRNTDQNIALTSTQIMEAQNQVRLSQPKKRGSRGWGTTVVDTRMGISLFYVNDKVAV